MMNPISQAWIKGKFMSVEPLSGTETFVSEGMFNPHTELFTAYDIAAVANAKSQGWKINHFVPRNMVHAPVRISFFMVKPSDNPTQYGQFVCDTSNAACERIYAPFFKSWRAVFTEDGIPLTALAAAHSMPEIAEGEKLPQCLYVMLSQEDQKLVLDRLSRSGSFGGVPGEVRRNIGFDRFGDIPDEVHRNIGFERNSDIDDAVDLYETSGAEMERFYTSPSSKHGQGDRFVVALVNADFGEYFAHTEEVAVLKLPQFGDDKRVISMSGSPTALVRRALNFNLAKLGMYRDVQGDPLTREIEALLPSRVAMWRAGLLKAYAATEKMVTIVCKEIMQAGNGAESMSSNDSTALNVSAQYDNRSTRDFNALTNCLVVTGAIADCLRQIPNYLSQRDRERHVAHCLEIVQKHLSSLESIQRDNPVARIIDLDSCCASIRTNIQAVYQKYMGHPMRAEGERSQDHNLSPGE